MSDIRITNCHTHTFTTRHIPKCYPHFLLVPLKKVPFLIRFIAFLVRFVSPVHAETLDRLYRFQKESDVDSQAEIYENIRRHYPANTRFVILPMDMAPIGHGRVIDDIRRQHDELAELAEANPDHVIPFATVHPDTPGGVEEALARLEAGFKGLKLYPKLGFAPSCEKLRRLYDHLQRENKPVVTHCSRGGVKGRWVSQKEADEWSAPSAFNPVWEDYPALKVNFAHFGGTKDWRDYVENGYHPDEKDPTLRNWQMALRRLIGGRDGGPVWTDISYTLFHFDDFLPFLRLFLTGETDAADRLRRRVLFGSDFYMTRQEKLSERAVCFRLRNALGDEIFRQISEVNPEIWLGERPEPGLADR